MNQRLTRAGFTLLSLWLASGCLLQRLRIKAEFDPAGVYGAASSPMPIVAVPQDVPIFMRTAPEGFTLANNELEVERGYGHKILGVVVVKYGGGDCWVGPVGKRDLIEAMQERAWSSGGNAVIYARSEWDESTTLEKRCVDGVQEPTYASGWVVELSPRLTTGSDGPR